LVDESGLLDIWVFNTLAVMPHSVFIQLIGIVCTTALFGAAIYLLSVYKRLYAGVKNVWLRHNLSVLTVALVIMAALFTLQVPELMANAGKKGIVGIILKEFGNTVIIALFVFNTVWLISRVPRVRNASFIRHHAIIIVSIVVSAIFIYSLLNYLNNGWNFKELHRTLIYAYFNSIVTGFIYTAVNYVELERKRKLNEKELEVTRLIALKTKAELDALHSKVNPHFLYNALNSIADLSITDGKKARRMTISLADLFRYSINYSNNNYSTIQDEVAMTEVYLQIEKIRFEDQLNYTVKMDEELKHYLVPRFILQPIVENAVKHGLKATGRMTHIELEVKKNENGIELIVADNGPAFPNEIVPGYGVKSVFDKLDLLFPGQFEIHFTNEPRKQLTIQIQKLVKNEPAV
jgi:two-component system LytT family sensor kinase